MEDGDVIDVTVNQQGDCIASPVPALFGKHLGSPGLHHLDDSDPDKPVAVREWRAVVSDLGSSLVALPSAVARVLDDDASPVGSRPRVRRARTHARAGNGGGRPLAGVASGLGIPHYLGEAEPWRGTPA